MAAAVDKALKASDTEQAQNEIIGGYEEYEKEKFHNGEGRILKAATLLTYIHKYKNPSLTAPTKKLRGRAMPGAKYQG